MSEKFQFMFFFFFCELNLVKIAGSIGSADDNGDIMIGCVDPRSMSFTYGLKTKHVTSESQKNPLQDVCILYIKQMAQKPIFYV